MNASLLWNTLVVQLKASPSRAAALGVLLLILVVITAGQLVGGPRSAEAAPPPVSIVPRVTAEPTPASLRASRPPLPKLPDMPVRDLFSTDWAGFAPVPITRLATETDDVAGQAKPAPRWVLELTLTDPTPRGQHSAVINGSRVRIGDKILGLTVKTIAPGIVILVGEKNERIVLQMN